MTLTPLRCPKGEVAANLARHRGSLEPDDARTSPGRAVRLEPGGKVAAELPAGREGVLVVDL